MKIKRGHIFMLLGVLLVAGAVGLSVYNYVDDKRAGEAAHAAYEELYSVIENNIKNQSENDPFSLNVQPLEMKTEKIKGREFVGVISIPSIKVELPVQSECTDEKLRYSPCRYKGNVFDGSMIIAGHNYITHFSKLYTLKKGDKVVFTDVDGLNYNYKVADVYNLGSTSVKEMEAQGDWDLTLFTCTYGNRQRVTVRCIRA